MKKSNQEKSVILIRRQKQDLKFEVTLEPLGIEEVEEVPINSNTNAAPQVVSHGSHTNNDGYKTKYGVAHGVSNLTCYFGWGLVIIGAIVTLVSIVNGIKSQYGGLSLFDTLSGIGITVTGFLLIMGAQITLATIDNADHTREILKTINTKFAQNNSPDSV